MYMTVFSRPPSQMASNLNVSQDVQDSGKNNQSQIGSAEDALIDDINLQIAESAKEKGKSKAEKDAKDAHTKLLMSIAEANRNDALTGMHQRNRSSQKREGRSSRAAFADGSQHPEMIKEEVEGAEHRDKMSKMTDSMDQKFIRASSIPKIFNNINSFNNLN